MQHKSANFHLFGTFVFYTCAFIKWLFYFPNRKCDLRNTFYCLITCKSSARLSKPNTIILSAYGFHVLCSQFSHHSETDLSQCSCYCGVRVHVYVLRARTIKTHRRHCVNDVDKERRRVSLES